MHVPVALRGPLSIPFRMLGIRPSAMNPNTRTLCELMFTRVMKARNITVDVSVLFADLRGYTGLSQSHPPEAIASLLDVFYDECASAIWAQDGLLNKTIGDSVMAVFNFPIRHSDHARRAILAARDIQQRCRAQGKALVGNFGLSGADLGVGIDSGEVKFGEFGRSHRDLTAIGTVVNMAARAQSAAAAGQILATKAVYDRARPEFEHARAEDFRLKGFESPVQLFSA